MESPGASQAGGATIRHFRQILLWPLELLAPPGTRGQLQRPWEWLTHDGSGAAWEEVPSPFSGDPSAFSAHTYTEFVTLLPNVQRFLYGEPGTGERGEAPVRIFERAELARVRVSLAPSAPPVELTVERARLYFFYDIQVAILVTEVRADDLSLATAQDLLFRFGRSYPAFWETDGRPGNCPLKVEWLSPDGETVAASDYEARDRYLSTVANHRAPAISADWMKVLEPLRPVSSDARGVLRYRPLEYARMPVMALLAVEDPTTLTRGDFARLAHASRPSREHRLPYSESVLRDFEESCCYDQYWNTGDPQVANTRFVCTGNTFLVVADARHPFVAEPDHGVVARFRHQYFLLGLIAHFHRASLLHFRDRLERAVARLDIRDLTSIRAFKREIRLTFEIFLRFTHRYWFYEVSLQPPAKPLFAMWRRHLGIGHLYDEIRREVQDMAQYLDSDGLRRQANTVVRLTVVTTTGLIATVTTGFLGMNLIDAADEPLAARVGFFALVLLLTTVATAYTIVFSKRLSDYLEILSDERIPLRRKLAELGRVVWRG